MLNKYGERTQSCRTPFLTLNHSDSDPAILTLASCFPYSLVVQNAENVVVLGGSGSLVGGVA